MESNYIIYFERYFEWLISNYKFQKHNELIYNSSYSVEYASTTFVIKIEKYRREFYTTLYKVGHPEEEINLFNLLQYLYKDTPNIPEAEYFDNESNITECYRKQIEYIANTINNNYSVINDFFGNENYESKFIEIRRFMIEKYPHLFKRI